MISFGGLWVVRRAFSQLVIGSAEVFGRVLRISGLWSAGFE